ncbi:hypothetical protein GZL_00554 [Streptomyces sp. 769]|nr:hypothetical protein GZL_00554 [Streptomyces sp. 769]
MLVDPNLAMVCLAGTYGSVEFHFHHLHSADPQQTWQRLREDREGRAARAFVHYPSADSPHPQSGPVHAT